jgi:hypothetical protein
MALAGAQGAPVNVLGGPASSGADPNAPQVTAVDPQARLEELLRQRYQSEIHRRAQSETTRRSGEMLAGAGSSAMSAIFGAAGRGQL